MNIFSLTQRWSPAATLDEDGEPERTHFQIIMNEVSGERVAGNLSSLRYTPQRLVLWAAAHLPEVEAELWLEKPELLVPFTRAFPEFTVKLAPKASHLNAYFSQLEEQLREFQTADDASLLEMFDQESALRFYSAAWRYLEGDLWGLGSLQFRSSQGQRYRLDFGDEDEPGFAICDVQGNLCLGVSFDNAAFVAARDLEFLDEHRLDFGTSFYPWILFSTLPGGLTRDWLETLIWLLDALPHFGDAPVGSGSRRLDWWPAENGLAV